MLKNSILLESVTDLLPDLWYENLEWDSASELNGEGSSIYGAGMVGCCRAHKERGDRHRSLETWPLIKEELWKP